LLRFLTQHLILYIVSTDLTSVKFTLSKIFFELIVLLRVLFRRLFYNIKFIYSRQ